MATQRTTRVKKHISLSAEVAADLEVAAREAKVTVSDVIEARIRDYRQGEMHAQSVLETRVEQLVMDMADLRAKVLPLVATVTALLRQMEGELPVTLEEPAAEPAPRIVTYEEMYGPITPDPAREPRPAPLADVPKPRWWRR
jgi:hypothetical protein